MSDEIFKPFKIDPVTPEAAVIGEHEASGQPFAPAAKKPRKISKHPALAAPYGKPKRQRKIAAVNAAMNPAPNETPMLEMPKAKKPRKKRTVPKVRLPKESAGMKVSIEMALSALGALKQEDAAVFEKVAGILNAAGSSQRARVLDALGKVFA